MKVSVDSVQPKLVVPEVGDVYYYDDDSTENRYLYMRIDQKQGQRIRGMKGLNRRFSVLLKSGEMGWDTIDKKVIVVKPKNNGKIFEPA